MRKRQFTPSRDLNLVINDRLKLQSTQNQLNHEFGVFIPSISYLKTERFETFYNKLEGEKQKRLYFILGGVYQDKLPEYLSNLLKKETYE